MIVKLGVTSLDGLRRDRTWLGHPKRFALSLYGRIVRDHAELDAWLPRILERHQTHSGAFKRTLDRRFEELDALVARRFAELRTGPDATLRVHDAAVSDGRSSVELHDRLRRDGPVDFVASDRDPAVYVVRPRGGGWEVALDEEGNVVQYVGSGFVVSPVAPEHALVYPVNRVALTWLSVRLRKRAHSLWRRAMEPVPADLERREVDGHEVWRVPLICRPCLERMQKGQIRFVRHDICDPLPGAYHLVRAMNVLNHLPSEALRLAVRSLRGALEDGGLLVVGRSADPGGETRATVWRREGSRLRAIERTHGGSELAGAIEAQG